MVPRGYAHGRPSSFKILQLNAIRNQCEAVGIPWRKREREKVETSLEPMAHMQIEVRRAETRERNLLTRGSWVPDMTSRPVCWNLAGIVTEIEIRSDGETAEDGIYARQIRSFGFIMRWINVKLRTETFRVESRRKCRSWQTGTLCNCLANGTLVCRVMFGS